MAEEEMQGWGATDAPMDGYASEGELDTRKLIAMKNKKKKSGGFQSFGLTQPVYRGVLKKGYKVPTPIQRKTIPLIMEGKDVVAMARTGSGKTAAFLIPMFEKLNTHSAQTGARALILSPTRELALQTLKFTKELGKFTGLRAAVILGGESLEGQFAAIHENPDIIIATPGRLVHVCVEMDLKLKSVEYVVFDEADRLYELGFATQLDEILGRLSEVRQTLLFSATLPKLLVEFARAGLNDPVLIRLDAEHVLSENLRLAFFKVNTENKLGLLFYVLQNVLKNEEQAVVFTATRHDVEYLHQALDLANIPNTYCYSALDPAARKINVAKFRSKVVRCLVVTDVAARGIDLPFLDNVINYHFPGKSKLFVHRVGRVARAGRSGVAYSFVAPDEAPYLLDLHLFLSKTLKLAPHPPDKHINWDYLYGSVPQSIMDSETEKIEQMHTTNTDLENLKKVCNNAYKQYSKSRPAPSTESVKRMKETELINTIGFHPLLIQDAPEADLEEKRLAMLESLKNLQPKGTVFEMHKTKNAAHVQAMMGMKMKREYDGKRIENFHKNRETLQAAKLEKEEKAKEVSERLENMEQSTEIEVEESFKAILGKKRKRKVENNGEKKRKNKENESFKDKEFYIPYTKDNEFAEEGYKVTGSFNQAVEAASMDLVADEDGIQRKNSALHRWDRHKKKFVGTQTQQKRIKTESGVWIAASYKTDRYKKWMARGRNKGTLANSDDEEEGGNNNNNNNKNFKAIKNKSFNNVHPLLKGQRHPGGKFKREIKTDDEIAKETKRKEAERQKHLEGFQKNQEKRAKREKALFEAAKKERADKSKRMSKKKFVKGMKGGDDKGKGGKGGGKGQKGMPQQMKGKKGRPQQQRGMKGKRGRK